MDDPHTLYDNIMLFLQAEYRGGFLRADPAEVCTISFFEHLGDFIGRQEFEAGQVYEARIAELNAELARLQRQVRWCARFRGGPRR